jgi:hypothetical protein
MQGESGGLRLCYAAPPTPCLYRPLMRSRGQGAVLCRPWLWRKIPFVRAAPHPTPHPGPQPPQRLNLARAAPRGPGAGMGVGVGHGGPFSGGCPPHTTRKLSAVSTGIPDSCTNALR